MKFIFVSNYINHHQIPFCEAMRRRLGENFCFIQTEPMAEERVRMGWGVDLARLPYVRVLYGEPEAVGQLEQEILDRARGSGTEETVRREAGDPGKRAALPRGTVEGAVSAGTAPKVS